MLPDWLTVCGDFSNTSFREGGSCSTVEVGNNIYIKQSYRGYNLYSVYNLYSGVQGVGIDVCVSEGISLELR